MMTTDDDRWTSTLRLTPRMRRTMQSAERHARAAGHDYVGTEHVLLALTDDGDGIAGSLLARHGVSATLRAELLTILDQAPPGPSGQRAT